MKDRTKKTEEPQKIPSSYPTNDTLISYHNTVKKTIQEYVVEVKRYNSYKTVVNQTKGGTVLDDRARLIDLYEACRMQDAHLQAVIETLYSHLTGERYMLARQSENGKWVRDVKESLKVYGTQFEKFIIGILDAKLYGYSLIETDGIADEDTGLLKNVELIERRNVLPSQHRVILRQHQWLPGWNIDKEQYKHNYILIDSGELGLFAATTPLILAKKYTLANWTNFSHTYGQPIIHGKTSSEDNGDRKRLANSIAGAAQNKILVTGKDDEIDIKAFTMSNSEQIYKSLLDFVNAEVSNLILGSQSMAGAMQSYVGATKAHEDIFRARIKTYRRYVEREGASSAQILGLHSRRLVFQVQQPDGYVHGE